MLNHIELHLQSELPFNYHMGSLFHGFLMERVSSDYGVFLHENQLKPFSQYFRMHRDPKQATWHVSAFDELAYEQLLQPLLSLEQITLKYNGLTADVASVKKFKPITYEALMDQCLVTQKPKRVVKINFETLTAFRSDKKYILFPQMHMLFHNLASRWDAYSGPLKVYDREIIYELAESTEVIEYQLRTNRLQIGKGFVKGFIGEAVLKLDGPDSIVRLGNLLLHYANFAGIGIKTTLGMGGVHINFD